MRYIQCARTYEFPITPFIIALPIPHKTENIVLRGGEWTEDSGSVGLGFPSLFSPPSVTGAI